jgi:hypothetical protein
MALLCTIIINSIPSYLWTILEQNIIRIFTFSPSYMVLTLGEIIWKSFIVNGNFLIRSNLFDQTYQLV